MNADDGNFQDFPVGQRVQVRRCVEDFHAWRGDETGYVIANSGQYLGVIVHFDTPIRMRSNHEAGTYTMTKFNFNPKNLMAIEDD